MVEDNIKDFTLNWIILGLLAFSLISFAISFMYNNNPGGFGEDASSKFNSTKSGLNNKLYALSTDSDKVLNITANTNPEASDLGSRDSVAAAYQTRESSTNLFNSIKLFVAWIFVGEMGKMLLTVFAGIFGFTSVYFIVKWIRNGI